MDLLFSFPGYEELSTKIMSQSGVAAGDVIVRHFPDGESFVQLQTDVRNKNICIVCGLDQPDQKTVPLMFFSKVAKELGAKRVGLIAPYLGYMRQDKRFQDGEAITSQIFAQFLAGQVDWLLTIDPHLHRYKALNEIYSIPCQVLHTTHLIANWIKDNVVNPLLIGPDQESEQWVSDIALEVGSPFIILTKTRHGDKDVDISLPQVDRYKSFTPVLIDDIISTARTMIAAIGYLHHARIQPPVCIGIHPIFAEDAYTMLKNSGVSRIATCNTITHPSNEIDVSELLSTALIQLKQNWPDSN